MEEDIDHMISLKMQTGTKPLTFKEQHQLIREAKALDYIRMRLKDANDKVEAYMAYQALNAGEKKSPFDTLLSIMIDTQLEERKWCKAMLAPLPRAVKPKGDISKDQINEARKFPIDSLIKFNSAKKACCIWHSEKSASMTFYPKTNSVYCFGCNKKADVIDVVQQIHSFKFKEAVNFIIHQS